MSKNLTTLAITVLALLGSLAVTHAQPTAFNYTGYLLDGSSPASGSNDLRFTLYATNSGGLPVTNTPVITVTNQTVTDGIFVVALDFGGGAFDGNARWLEIAARPGGSANPFTNAFPRQPITAAPYAVYAYNGVPVGSVMAYMGTNPPAGWLLCDGASLSRATYAALYAVIGNSSGTNSATTFKLPDLRGMFLRGVNGSRADAYTDPDVNSRAAAGAGGNTNSVGSVQTDQLKSHNHSNGVNDKLVRNDGNNTIIQTDFNVGQIDCVQAAPILPFGGNETRPKNVYVNYIIKY
jgi:microcystin-dependent protein